MKRMPREPRHHLWTIALPLLMALGCSHALKVKNLDMYATPMRITEGEHHPAVAVLPYAGTPDGLFFFNAVVDRLNMDPGIGAVRTDYIAHRASATDPDLIVSILPHVEYRSSGWNFLINWPGFLLFTPAWNGYVYRADVLTKIGIQDAQGNALSQTDIPISYDIRQAEMDRTIFTGLTWLEVSALAFIGGIYNATTFDRDLLGPLQIHIRDNYANYVSTQLQPKIRAAADAVMSEPDPAQAVEVPEAMPAVEPSPDVAAPPVP